MSAAPGGTGGAGGPTVKEQVATPLAASRSLDDKSYERLRALSVSTVEELLGLIAADPEAVHDFVPELDLPQIQADAPMEARGGVLAEFEKQEGAHFALGARAPDDVEVEERASAAYVASWLDEAVASTARGVQGDSEPTVNLLSCFGRVRDQADRGTCVAHAVVAVLECQRRRLHGEDVDLSEQYVYWLAKERDGQPQQEGTWLQVAMPATQSEGACLEETWPYNPAKTGDEGQGPPPEDAAKDAFGRSLEGPSDLGARDIKAMRASLDAGRPFGISVPVYNNWYSNPAAHTLGLIPMPLPNSVQKSGHAMCAVGYGYDPDFAGGGYFILRNSWDVTWAPQSPIAPGYGAIPFLYVKKYGWEAWNAA